MLLGKRTIAFFLAIVMVFSVLPLQAFAEENEIVENQDNSSNENTVVVSEETTTIEALNGGAQLTYNGTVEDKIVLWKNDAWDYYRSNQNGTETIFDEVIITNTTEDQLLSFDYEIRSNIENFMVDGVAPGSVAITVNPQSSITISFEIPVNTSAGRFYLKNLKLEKVTQSGIVFQYDESLGTVTVDGTTIASGTDCIIPATGAVLKATPKEGTSFLGWVNASGDTHTLISNATEYTLVPSGQTTVKAAFINPNATAWFLAGGSHYSDNLGEAAQYAENSQNKKVVLLASGTVEGDHVIPAGVTVLVPYNKEHTVDTDTEPTIVGVSGSTFTQQPISASVAYRTLTVKSGAVITVKGNLNVNSAVFSVGSRDTGNPHGPYGLMVLENNAELKIANGGKLYCYGFIIGTYDGDGNYTGGKVVAEDAGSVYELFQIRDLGGRKRMQAKVDAFPMTQYYVQNIEAKYEILPSATSSAIISARNGYMGGQQDFPFVGKDSGLFRLTAGKLTRLYDPMTDRTEYTLGSTQSAGVMSVDALIIDLKGIYTVRSSDYYLAINGNLGITLESGTSATVNQNVKLLPGVKFDVAENATLTVSQGASLTLYDSDDWKDNYVYYATENDTAITGSATIYPNNAGTARNVVRYSPSRAQVKGTISRANHGSAQLNVDGTLVAYGNVYSTSGWKAPTAESFTANTSLDNVLSGTGTYINYAAYGDVTLNEFYNNSDSSFAKVSTQPLLGNIVADGKASVTSFPDGTAEGVTYQGFYQDVNANGKAEATEYMWTDGEVASVTVKLMHGGEVAGTETMTVYSGMDLSGYFTDEACTQAAGDDFSGDTLYAKATASITRNGQELYFRSPNAAISKAWYDETVKLIDDVVLASTMEVAAGQKLTLDLNNHSISGAGDVLINNGTLDITGGATGEGITPGKLIAGGTAITNSGTIGTIGGNLEVEAKGYLLDVAAGAVVNIIGGTNGVVTMTQNNESGKYAVWVKGQIGTIGGTNANVTIKQINKNNVFTATIFIDNVGGYITNIGGENATVNIIEDDQCEKPGKFRIAIWINNGHIGTLGNGGTVNIISNNLGIYYGGSTSNICYIEKVATAGTVNITGPVVDGEQDACIDAIYINSNVSENDIGILGAGGTVNINASQYGIRLGAAGADINQIATAGTVNITAGNIGIYLTAGGAKINTLGAGGTVNITAGTQGLNLLDSGNKITTIGLGGTVTITSVQEAIKVASDAEITTLGGKDSHVIITQNTGENAYLRTIDNVGTIDTIGGENAVVEITQNYQYTPGGSGKNPEVLNTSGTINRIGGLNAKVLIEQNAASGAGFGLRVDGGEVKKIGGSDVARVEIVSPDIPVYLAGSGKIKEIAQNTLFIRKEAYSQSVLWNTGTIEKITGGWFYSYTNTIADIFQKGVNAIGGASAAKSALNSIAPGYGISDKAVSIASEATGTTYNCYTVVPVSEIDAEAQVGNRYYTSLKTAVANAKSGETVILLKDISASLVVPQTTLDVTLDLNNHSITATSYVILNRGRINITGGAMTDADGNPLPAGKLITKGTERNSSCIYTQISDSGETFVGEIGTIGGNLELIDEAGLGRAAIYNSGASIGQIGTDGGKIKITTPGKVLEITSGATVGALGGAGSHVEMIQTGTTNVPAITVTGTITNIGYGVDSLVELTSVAKSIYVASGATLGALGGENSTVIINQNLGTTNGCAYVLDVLGTIDHIGDKNATVKITQISNAAQDQDNGNAKLIYVKSGAKINHIGTEIGSKVLVNQTVKSSGDCGWVLYVSGTVDAIGSQDSLVEIIADHSPVYLGGTLNTITGNTLMVGKRDYGATSNAFWMATDKTVGSITGGYFAQGGVTVGDGYADYIFDANNQKKIAGTADAPTGFALSETTVKHYSEAAEASYDCLYVCAAHEHTAGGDPVLDWITEDGQVMLRATAACAQDGCYEQFVVKSAATVTGAPEGDTYKLTYTATVSLGGEDYTETKTDNLQYAGEKTMKYDDRINGTDIRIINKGKPVETSLKVGTKERDDAVITAYGNKLIATGIGKAVAYIDDAVYSITVEKATIDLFMVTGHSVGMGSQGNTRESVLLDNGQAYSFTVTNTETGGYRYIDVIGETEGVGLGYAAAKRPDEVDNFTAAGGGVIGEDSGLAWQWNRMTGHKVYVINSAVGSTSMYHWYLDKSNSDNPVPILSNAIANFTSARQIIQNEVDAGHFEMGTMTLLNHSSANYTTDDWSPIKMLYNDEDGEVWFNEVLGKITNAMNIDWDKDGTVEKASETMSVGFVPIWTRPKNTTSTSVGISFASDKPAVMYMGASDTYEDYFVASLIGLDRWGNDEKVQAYFKDYVQEYTAQNGQTLEVPSTNLGLYPDYVHYKQFAYNEMGIDIAKNVYTRLYGNTQTVSLKLLKTDGKTEVAAEDTEELDLNGGTLKLVPVVDPISIGDLTFTAEGSMGIKWPLTLYAKSAGEGSLTISYKGTILKTLTMNVDAVAQVGETNYVTLTEAINNAPAEGTVVLLKDLSLSTGITIAEDKNLTLDLNNHSITVAGAALTNYGTLNITGGEAGEDKTPGALVATSGTAVVNYGHIGTIGGNLKLEGKTAIHVNHANASIDLIGGENATVSLKSVGSNTIYIQNGSIGTISATGTGLVTLSSDYRGILVMSDAPKADGYDLEAITGNVSIDSLGAAIYVKNSRVGTVGGNGTITMVRHTSTGSSKDDGAIHLVSGGKIHALGGANATVAIESVTTGIYMSGGSQIGTIGSTGTGVVDIDSDNTAITLIGTNTKIGTIGGTGANVTITQNNTATSGIVKTVYVEGGRIDEIGGENANVTIEMTDPSPSGTRIAVWLYNGGSIGTLGSGGNVKIICPRIGVFTASGKSGEEVADSARGWIENIGKAGVVTIDAYNPIAIYGNKNRAAIDHLGAGGTVNIIADGIAIDLMSKDALISNIATAGTVNITAGGTAINLPYTGSEITNVGNGGTLVVNSDGNALNLATGTTVGTLGGTDSKVTMVSSGSYPVNIVGGHIGTIGGKNAKVNLICDKASGNSVVLNVSNEASGTVGTIGGENAEIILHQRGATTGIQYGILLNGTSTKTAQIEKIGAGAKFVEVIVDDCPVFLDGESKILAIEENVLLVARTVSTATTATHVFSGTPQSAVINGGKFCRGNSNDINVVLDSANQTGKNFTKNTLDVVANTDGQTYKCFVAHNHPYTATVTDPTCTEPGYTTYTCDCGDTYVAEEVAASGHTYGVPAYNWKGTELTVTLTCDKCEEGTENKVLTGNAQGEVKSSTEGDCQTKATVTYTATVPLNGKDYTYETTIDGELGEHNLVVTEAKEATCTTPGNNEYYTCSVEGCGKVFKADKTTETTVDAETIQTTNHTPGEPVEKNRVEATATENGSYDLVVYCSVCKTHEISRKTVVIPAAGAPVEVKIDDKTKGAATITEPAGGWHYGEENTFTVTYDKSCVVVVKDADGNYTRLPASGDGNTKSYTVTLEEGMELVVAIKGDMDGNGKIRIADVIALAQAEATGDYSSYSMLIGDMDENNKIRIADVIALAQLEAQG